MGGGVGEQVSIPQANMPSTTVSPNSPTLNKVGGSAPAYAMNAPRDKTASTIESPQSAIKPTNPGMSLSGIPQWLMGGTTAAPVSYRPPNIAGTATNLNGSVSAPTGATTSYGSFQQNNPTTVPQSGGGLPQVITDFLQSMTGFKLNSSPANTAVQPSASAKSPIQLLDPNYQGTGASKVNPNVNQYGMAKPTDFDRWDKMYKDVDNGMLQNMVTNVDMVSDPTFNDYLAYRIGPYAFENGMRRKAQVENRHGAY